jgi:hypothetical protein
MAILIQYPKGGAASAHQELPKQFLAWGTKDPQVAPMGIMVSVNPNNKPNGKHFIGGTTLEWKPGNPNTKKWAIYFRMPKDLQGERFSLWVFDVMNLAGGVQQVVNYLTIKYASFGADVAQGKVTQAHIGAKSPAPHGAGPSDGGRMVFTPGSMGTASRIQFVAQGVFPANEADLDASTRVEDANGADSWPLDWSWSDGVAFWGAFFPEIPETINQVNLKIIYKPNWDEEDVNGITLV